MKLRHTRGIHDFNRALAIDPKLFQVSFTQFFLLHLNPFSLAIIVASLVAFFKTLITFSVEIKLSNSAAILMFLLLF